MKNIIKFIKPYKLSVLLVVALLIVQAYCDLGLPAYTSDIIDIGIQSGGIEHILPKEVKPDEYERAELFMDDGERAAWESAYEKSGDNYVLTASEEELGRLDAKLIMPIVMTYELSHLTEDSFLKMTGQSDTGVTAQQIIDASGMNVDVFTAENENGKEETYYDVRAALSGMISTGTVSQDELGTLKRTLKDTADTIGTDTLMSMGRAYAKSADEDAGIDTGAIQKSYLWKTGAVMMLMAFIMLSAAVCATYVSSRVGAGVGRDIRDKVYRNVMGYSSAEMDKFSSASLITRSTNDVQQVQMVIVMMLKMVLYAPIVGLGGIYRVAETEAHMWWIIGLAVLVLMGVVLLLVVTALPKFRIMQDLVDRVNLVAREILTGLQVIRAFGREETEEERFDRASMQLKKTQLFTNRVMTFMMPGMMLIMYCLVISIMWFGGRNIDAGNLQIGALTAFISYSMQIVIAFLMMTVMSIILPRAGVAADRIAEVIDAEPSIRDPEAPVTVADKKGVVEYCDVSFRYPGAQDDVISGVSFTAMPGEVTAVIGSTGSGKSTLVNLLPRFYDVTGGSIKVDGVDIRDYALCDLRGEIGFVPQKGVLFSGTIESNLRFGAKDAPREEIEKAAQIAQAAGFIDEKEEKYASLISQGGGNVSGGQKQRLAIARAIAGRPLIYVFDDSFSALDMKTDAKLRRALAGRVSDAAVIIVAQRISTIINADRILVLDEGRIVGDGIHEELLRSCSVYEQIARSQLSAKELGLEEDEKSYEVHKGRNGMKKPGLGEVKNA